jgi:class 3 adenylate cyclase
MQDDSAAASGRKPSLERRLATILMADVVGYSKMVGENEERTIEVLRGHREVFDEILKLHRGRVFNTAGDAILAEFPSAVDAVRCATEVQAALRTRNDHLSPEQRMVFRIGINLGDVIVQGGDLLGDGVNVAARIQTVADPGGICISGSVYDQIQNKLSLQFRQLGVQNFKNIAQPIRTFSITDSADGTLAVAARRRVTKPRLAAGALALVALAAAGGGYVWYHDYESRLAEQARVADAQRKAEQARVVADAAQHESKLEAELQAAKDALQQAEAAKRKSELDRVAAESAQREAKLQGELNAAKVALQKAEQSGQKADMDSKSAGAALRAVEKASRRGAELDTKGATGLASKSMAASEVAAKSAVGAAADGPARFDGNYQGRFCNYSVNKGGPARCWTTVMSAQQGKLSATWPSRIGEKPVHASGTIASDGSSNVTIDGFSVEGHPMRATMTGNWAADKITLSGTWRNGIGINANLARVH